MSGKRKQKNNFETTDSVRKAGQKKKVVKRGKFEINLSPRDVTSPILTVTRDYNIMANEVAKNSHTKLSSQHMDHARNFMHRLAKKYI